MPHTPTTVVALRESHAMLCRMVRSWMLVAVLGTAATLGLSGCGTQPAAIASSSTPVTHVTTPAAAPLTAIAHAQIEERCDDLAAKRFASWHGVDPVFVSPTFSAGANGQTLIQQRVSYTDSTGTPRTSLLECAGKFHAADNTTTAKLVILTRKS